MSMSDLHTEMKRIKKRDEEVSFRVNKVEEYLGQFLQIKNKSHLELVGNIKKLEIPRLKTSHIIKIADILPTSPEEVKMALQGYPISLTGDSLKKIAKVVEGFAPTPAKGKE